MNYEIEFTERSEVPTAVVRQVVAIPEIAAFLGGAFGEVMAAVSAAGCFPVGPPLARFGMTQVPKESAPETFAVEAGFPVNAPIAPSGRVEASALPAGPVAVTVHAGSYADVSAAYEAIEARIAEAGLVPTGAPWEAYLDDPTTVPVPHTEVVWPCGKPPV